MSSTFRTRDLRPRHTESAVSVPVHGTRNAVEVGGPAAAGLEFVSGGVEGCVASCASL